MRNDLVQKHGGSLLYVVAASMEQGVHGEVRTLGQIVGVATPGNGLCLCHVPLVSHLLRIQTDADRHLLLERLQIALESLFAHHQTGLLAEFFGQLWHFFYVLGAKLKKKCELCN